MLRSHALRLKALRNKTGQITRAACVAKLRLMTLGLMAVGVAQAGGVAQLPATHVKSGFSLEQASRFEAQASVQNILSGGDVALYWTNHVARTMPTAVIPAGQPARALEVSVRDEIGNLRASTALGELSLNEFLYDSRSYAQGFVVVHKGRIIFEEYPGMRPQDNHLWASNAKPLASLLIDLLIEDGELDQNQTFGHYVPEFRGTAWENLRIIDILDMTPGLDTAEDGQTRKDPNSIAIRTFLSEFNQPYAKAGKVESIKEVLKDARKIAEPGESFDYGSPVTQALVILTETITQKKWSDYFDQRVWSKMSAEAGLQVHLAPDGTAAVHGVVSSRLRDMARFGMLYTPSWDQVAVEQIVSPEVIGRIRNGVRDHDFFMSGYDGPVFTERLGETIPGSSRQWDVVFADGDFFKSGLMGQGLYVSPDRDLVIAFFSTARDPGPIQRYLRPLAKSISLKDTSSPL